MVAKLADMKCILRIETARTMAWWIVMPAVGDADCRCVLIEKHPRWEHRENIEKRILADYADRMTPKSEPAPEPALADLLARILRPATVATYDDLHWMLVEVGHDYSRQAIAAAVKRDPRFKARPGRRIKSDGTPYRNAGYVPATVQRIAEPIS